MKNHFFPPMIIVAGLGLLAACGSTAPGERPAFREPTVDQPGSTIMRYRGPEIEVLIDHKYAGSSLGEDWLIINVAFSGTDSKATEIARRSVKIKMPDGRKVSIPEHRDFTRAYSEFQSAARRAALASGPLDFTSAGRRSCDLSFQPIPGTGVAVESVHVNMRRICQGLLFFPIPGGVQPGNWTLIVEFEEDEVRLPFVLEG